MNGWKSADEIAICLLAVIAILLTTVVTGMRYGETPWSSNVGDLVRSGATVGGFVLALLAYLKWRRPDDRKRQADTAQMVLRASGDLQVAAEAARPKSLVVQFETQDVTIEDRMEALRNLGNFQETVAELRKQADKFGTYHAEARVLYTEEVARLMVEFLDDCRKVITAHERAAILLHDRIPPHTAGFDRSVRSTLSVLGIRVIPDYLLDEDDERDVFGEKLTLRGEAFRIALAEYVRPKHTG